MGVVCGPITLIGRGGWELFLGLMLVGKGEVGVVSGPNVN